MTSTTFAKRASLIHGDRFSYDKVNYVSTKTPVVITCRQHGDFTQRPDHHLDIRRRGGCRKCYDESLLSKQSDVIDNFMKIHGNVYGYDLVLYKGMRHKVTIVCNIHGEFLQTPSSHMSGSGCPFCAKEKLAKNPDDFIKSAVLIHGNRYDYSMVDYKSSGSYVKIVCPDHGVFEKTPDNHCHKTKPQGCPRCAVYTGFSDRDAGFVYVIRSTDGRFMKIGLSNNPRKRIVRLAKSTPFEFSIIEVIKFGVGKDARKAERKLHELFKSAGMTGFDGCTEWFVWDNAIVDSMRALSKGA